MEKEHDLKDKHLIKNLVNLRKRCLDKRFKEHKGITYKEAAF
ncbi:hypothetical protein OROHE_024733 [Orobanche hederae]